MKDEHVIGLVGGGVGLYLLYRWKEGEGASLLPDFGSLFAGLGGGLSSLDLSNLIGGINLGELLKGVTPDVNAVEEYVRGLCTPGGGLLPDENAQAPAPEQGREPTLPDFPFPEPTSNPVAETVNAVAGLNPWLQAGLGVAAGGLGFGTGAIMVRTSPAIAAGLSKAVSGAGRVAADAYSWFGGKAAARVSAKAAQQAAQRSATSAAVKLGTTRYVLPAPAKGWLGRTLGVSGVVAALSFVFGGVATEFGRMLYGEQAPEKVVGWGLLSAFSVPEWVREALGGVSAAPMGVSVRMPTARESYQRQPFTIIGDVGTPFRQLSPASVAAQRAGSEEFAAQQRYERAVAGRESGTPSTPARTGGKPTKAYKEYFSSLPF